MVGGIYIYIYIEEIKKKRKKKGVLEDGPRALSFLVTSVT